MAYDVSPLAPKHIPALPPVKGVKLATRACGLRYKNRDDVLVVECAENSVIAAVFTTSKTASANVRWGQKALPHHQGRVLVVSAGNANAFNGSAGMESVSRIVAACAELWNCPKEWVYPCATGVIGQVMDDSKITSQLPALKDALKEDAWDAAARAIMTTDTFPKLATRQAKIGDVTVTINGIAKGSGMIEPNMATLLSYVFTDAHIAAPVLQEVLKKATDRSFNCITVDSDTSTSDTLLLFATGQAGHAKITRADDAALSDFKQKLLEVLQELAQLVIKDGEGASKFITVQVKGAEDERAARVIAKTIANSPLVKTAIAGEDANWGRIVAAAGRAGEAVDAEKMTVAIGGVIIAKEGQLNPEYREESILPHMKGQNILIELDAGTGGAGETTVWTCDLTHGYISINADYRS